MLGKQKLFSKVVGLVFFLLVEFGSCYVLKEDVFFPM